MYFSVCLGNTHRYTLLPLATVLPSCLCKFSISGLGLFLRAKPCLTSCVIQCEVWCSGPCVEAQAQGFFPQQPHKWKTVGWIQSQYHSFFEGLEFMKPFTKVLRAKTPCQIHAAVIVLWWHNLLSFSCAHHSEMQGGLRNLVSLVWGP